MDMLIRLLYSVIKMLAILVKYDYFTERQWKVNLLGVCHFQEAAACSESSAAEVHVGAIGRAVCPSPLRPSERCLDGFCVTADKGRTELVKELRIYTTPVAEHSLYMFLHEPLVT